MPTFLNSIYDIFGGYLPALFSTEHTFLENLPSFSNSLETTFWKTMQERERAAREKEATAQQLRAEAEYARSEAEEHLRRQKEEAAKVAAELQVLEEARERQERDFSQREQHLTERVRLRFLGILLLPLAVYARSEGEEHLRRQREEVGKVAAELQTLEEALERQDRVPSQREQHIARRARPLLLCILHYLLRYLLLLLRDLLTTAWLLARKRTLAKY
jgi:hypothetical protein